MTAYEFGDIILVGFPHTDLQNISKRPALVLYDSGDEDVLFARITAQEYVTEADYKIVNWKACGLIVESYIRLGKQATLEKKYIIKRLGTLDSHESKNVRIVLQKIFLP